jgi:cytochrome c553
MWAAQAGAPMEPIGRRIVEIPVDLERSELRDPRSGFVAYVPPGSIAKGEALALATRGDLAPPCATCHGPDLKGVDPAPPIAGRSASYIVRQLFDIQSGLRSGELAELMKPVVAGLTIDDMIALAAFAASRAP